MNSLFNALAVIQNTVNVVTGQSLTNLTTASTIASLNMTAEQLHEFHMELEDVLQITIPWTTVEGWTTVGDAVTWLNAQINDAAAN